VTPLLPATAQARDGFGRPGYLHGAEPRHPFEEELEKVRRLYPTMSESKVHDEARRRAPEAWESYKGLTGAVQFPQAHDGDHSGADQRSLENLVPSRKSALDVWRDAVKRLAFVRRSLSFLQR
jgi:hypothetical protein